MRAVLVDPAGPRWRRNIGGYLAAALVLSSPAVAGIAPDASAAVFCVAVAMLLIGPLLAWRLRRRTVTLEVAPGRLSWRGGFFRERLHARAVAGVSAAKLRSGATAIAIMRSPTDAWPVCFEVEGDEQRRALCDALGVGYDGFGYLSWQTEQRWDVRALRFVRLVGALAMIAFPTCMLAGPSFEPVGGVAALVGLAAIAMTLATRAKASSSPAPAVGMNAGGVSVARHAHERAVPWTRDMSLSVEKDAIALQWPNAPPELFPTRMPADVREHLVAQLEAAIDRARGLAPPRAELPVRAATLKRTRGETRRRWLGRLDALAATIAAPAQSAYRAATPFEEKELWSIVENHDADAETRAAAARVLSRALPERARVRIAEVAEATRDPHAHLQIRVALDDAQAAELDEADADRVRPVEWP